MLSSRPRTPRHSSSSPRHGGHGTPKSFFNLYLQGDEPIDATKLHVAVKEGDINTVKSILRSHKSLVHSPDKNGRTALHWTVVLGSTRCTKLILRYTSWWYLDRCDYNGCTALHYAAQASRSDEARMLLNRGAYVNARDHQGRTPMHYAALTGNPFIVQKLFAHGASVWMKDREGHMPLDLAENHDVLVLLDRKMEPSLSCFRICYPKRRSAALNEADRYPYVEEGNPVKRYLPKDMLKEKMTADAVRNKHNLEHAELERQMPAKVDTSGEARAKEKALEALLEKMREMKEADDEREMRRKLPIDYYR